MYERGGLYVDLDRLANQRLTTLIDVNVSRLILPLYRLSDFAQDLVGGAPGSLLHRHAIQLNLQRRQELRSRRRTDGALPPGQHYRSRPLQIRPCRRAQA